MKNNNNIVKMDFWFITGITDGDGGFNIKILEDQAMTVGWSVMTYF
jgi:hypothetical protein